MARSRTPAAAPDPFLFELEIARREGLEQLAELHREFQADQLPVDVRWRPGGTRLVSAAWIDGRLAPS